MIDGLIIIAFVLTDLYNLAYSSERLKELDQGKLRTLLLMPLLGALHWVSSLFLYW